MSVSLSLKLSEFPQNKTLFETIFLRWIRAIFAGPATFLVTPDPRHIDYPLKNTHTHALENLHL